MLLVINQKGNVVLFPLRNILLLWIAKNILDIKYQLNFKSPLIKEENNYAT